jgi:hypothetical protein
LAKVKDAKDRQRRTEMSGEAIGKDSCPCDAHTEHWNLEKATKMKIAAMSFCVSYNKD